MELGQRAHHAAAAQPRGSGALMAPPWGCEQGWLQPDSFYIWHERPSGNRKTCAGSPEPSAVDPGTSDSPRSSRASPRPVLTVEAEVYRGVPAMLTPHVCCGPGGSQAQPESGLEADPHTGGQEPQPQHQEKWRITLTSHVPHYGAKHLRTLESLQGFLSKMSTSDSSRRRESASGPALAAYPGDKPWSGPVIHHQWAFLLESHDSSRWKRGP